jgi:hypothetical protein
MPTMKGEETIDPCYFPEALDDIRGGLEAVDGRTVKAYRSQSARWFADET